MNDPRGITLFWLLLFYITNTVGLMIVAVREVKRPVQAVMWLVICLIFPIVGFCVYLITSQPPRIRRETCVQRYTGSEEAAQTFGPSATGIFNSLKRVTGVGIASTRVQVLRNGLETYQQLIRALRGACRTIDLDYYLYREDKIGRLITDILIQRAAAGVRIRFIWDGWGSRKLSCRELIRMSNAGIECRTFFPVRFPWLGSTFNYRDHHKIVIVDGHEAFVGGINIGDEYRGGRPNMGPWRDTHLRLEGEGVRPLQDVF